MTTRRSVMLCPLWVLLLTALVGLAPQTRHDFGSPTPAQLREQLADLDPEQPGMYFTTAETLANSDPRLASQILALGIGLARRAGDGGLAASMCIALASIETDPGMSAGLWDLALLLDPDRRGAWIEFRGKIIEAQLQIRREALQCVYAARFSDPQLASTLFDRVEIRAIIASAARGAGLDPGQVNALILSMIRGAEDDPCRGRVFVTERADGQIVRVVCPGHLRPIGVAPSDEQLGQLVKLELALSESDAPEDDGGIEPWGAVGYLKNDGAARDPSVGGVLSRYDVDLNRPYRRGDQWVSSP